MKKEKFKLKSKRIFLSKYFVIFVLIIFMSFMGSAYAIFNQTLTINGTINWNMVYTYYFEAPSNWNGSNIHAYLWNDVSQTKVDTWPGLAISSCGTSNSGKTVYKIEISSTVNSGYYNFDYDHVIFNDGTYQTFDIALDKMANVNSLAVVEPTYSSSTEKRIFAKLPKSWTTMYAYVWNNASRSQTCCMARYRYLK